MKSISAFLTVLSLSVTALASDINYDNIDGRYRADVAALGRTDAFNVTFTRDRKFTIQRIRKDGIEARICSGTFIIKESSSWFSSVPNIILQNTFSCPDPDPQMAAIVKTFDIDVGKANSADFIKGAAISATTSEFPITVSGTLKKQ